jgi:hypothetical protein
MSSENYEANDYGHDLDLLVIACTNDVLNVYPMRSSCKEESNQMTYAYLEGVINVNGAIHYNLWEQI